MSETRADLNPNGQPISWDALSFPRAKALAKYLAAEHHRFATLVDCRTLRSGGPGFVPIEFLIVDVEVQIPRERKIAILRHERFAIVFRADDQNAPEVWSLRSDFPEVVHLNPKVEPLPRSLCLSVIPWDEQRLSWTPLSFITLLRGWLARTARGENHQQDQALEPPFLSNTHHLILPTSFLDALPVTANSIRVFGLDGNVWAVLPAAPQGLKEVEDIICLCLPVVDQVHGVIDHAPADLAQLQTVMLRRGVDLFDSLRKHIQSWNEPKWYGKRLLLLMPFALRRSAEAPPDPTAVWAVLTHAAIGDVGEAIGAWIKGPPGLKYGAPLPNAQVTEVPVVGITIMATHLQMDPESAALYSNRTPDRIRIFAIGAGAIGSQVINLLVRSGFGTWTVIDKDRLFPHNLARHALSVLWTGRPKAWALHQELAPFGRFNDVPWSGLDATRLIDQPEAVPILSSAEAILDFSASLAVARHLAQAEYPSARRASFFMDPSGYSSVMLCEDKGRTLPLDVIEMQFYNHALTDPALLATLSSAASQVAYSGSCRERTFQISNDLVTLHAAIGANAVREVLSSPGASASIWLSDKRTRAIRCVELPLSATHLAPINDWRISVDDSVLNAMAEQRLAKLPKETGGVLIGGWDTYHRKVYIVNVIPSPPDSDEWPTGYVRGTSGLRDEVDRITKATDGRLGYVGEWHSHPDGCSSNASEDDVKVFAWIAMNRSVEGYPPVMAISGEHTSTWYLDELTSPLVLPSKID